MSLCDTGAVSAHSPALRAAPDIGAVTGAQRSFYISLASLCSDKTAPSPRVLARTHRSPGSTSPLDTSGGSHCG